MAHIRLDGTNLVLTLRPAERLIIRSARKSAFKDLVAGKPEVRFPLASVASVQVVPRPLDVLGSLGVRVEPLFGNWYSGPPVMALHTVRRSRAFTAVYGTLRPAILVHLAEPFPWRWLMVTVPDPDMLVKQVCAVARPG